MKRTILYFFLLFLLPLHMMAQYGGGDGRGEVTAVTTANQLNGFMPDVYGGGNGRGEADSILNGVQLNGFKLNIYSGGNGRGEADSIISYAQLNGIKLNTYGGGNGRGESDSMVSAIQLDGHSLSIYGGGNGRGETADTAVYSMQLNGVFLNIYSGGIGRGESALSMNTLQLDGAIENSMFMGGGGRGESSQQFNTTALPVTLLSFGASASGTQVKVQWQTATELNSAFFIVEHSVDGIHWQSIGKITAAGHSELPLSYQLFDQRPSDGNNYYRLQQNDLDGQFTYSNIAKIFFHVGSVATIAVYPNPVKYQLTVYVSGLPPVANLKITMLNAQGQVLFRKENMVGNKQILDISNFAAGIYYLVIDNSGQISTTKIIKE